MNIKTTSGEFEIIGPRTPGAKRANAGEYVFDFHAVNQIMGGPGYSPVFGGCVEGDRMIVALMRAPAGQMGDPHLHPNEQWIYILEGDRTSVVYGRSVLVRVDPGVLRVTLKTR